MVNTVQELQSVHCRLRETTNNRLYLWLSHSQMRILNLFTSYLLHELSFVK